MKIVFYICVPIAALITITIFIVHKCTKNPLEDGKSVRKVKAGVEDGGDIEVAKNQGKS